MLIVIKISKTCLQRKEKKSDMHKGFYCNVRDDGKYVYLTAHNIHFDFILEKVFFDQFIFLICHGENIVVMLPMSLRRNDSERLPM